MNKLTKLLSVFVIAGALGAGVAGVTACGGKGGAHTHNYSYTDNHNGTHDGTCQCGKDPITGEAHIWGDDNICDKCEAVYVAVEDISITGAAEVAIGDTITLTAVLTPTGASAPVTWSIKTGADKAEIDPATGALTGIKKGLVTVLATADGKTAEKSIQVKAIALSGVSLAKKSISLKPGEDYTLTPVFDPANASNKKITWTSSDTSVVTLSIIHNSETTRRS